MNTKKGYKKKKTTFKVIVISDLMFLIPNFIRTCLKSKKDAITAKIFWEMTIKKFLKTCITKWELNMLKIVAQQP